MKKGVFLLCGIFYICSLTGVTVIPGGNQWSQAGQAAGQGFSKGVDDYFAQQRRLQILEREAQIQMQLMERQRQIDLEMLRYSR